MKINTKWTFDILVIEALKYRNRKDFEKYSGAAFRVAKRYGLLIQICGHMDDAITMWTDEMLHKEALKYGTKIDFFNNSHCAYIIATKRKILDLICSHMRINRIIWTDEMLHKEALKYKTVKDFRTCSPKAYTVAQKRKILDFICSHMPDNFITWTVEMIQLEANKYWFRNQFKKSSSKAYTAATKRGILDEVCSHMKPACNSSVCENELFDFIKSAYPNARKLRDRKVNIVNKPYISGFDLDIYIPELNLAIEFDGAYWHSFDGLSRSRTNWPEEDVHNYHEIKDNWFLTKGISILHIDEGDWYRSKEECFKKCLNFLGYLP